MISEGEKKREKKFNQTINNGRQGPRRLSQKEIRIILSVIIA